MVLTANGESGFHSGEGAWKTATTSKEGIRAANDQIQHWENSSSSTFQNNGFLLVQNFNVIKYDLTIFNKIFQINFDEDTSKLDRLKDQAIKSNFTLREAFEEVFINHRAGILISEGKKFGAIHCNNKYSSLILILVAQRKQRQRKKEELVLLNEII